MLLCRAVRAVPGVREARQDRLHVDQGLVQLGARGLADIIDEGVAVVRKACESEQLVALREELLDFWVGLLHPNVNLISRLVHHVGQQGTDCHQPCTLLRQRHGHRCHSVHGRLYVTPIRRLGNVSLLFQRAGACSACKHGLQRLHLPHDAPALGALRLRGTLQGVQCAPNCGEAVTAAPHFSLAAGPRRRVPLRAAGLDLHLQLSDGGCTRGQGLGHCTLACLDLPGNLPDARQECAAEAGVPAEVKAVQGHANFRERLLPLRDCGEGALSGGLRHIIHAHRQPFYLHPLRLRRRRRRRRRRR
mmetsp:Transcript_123545/g.360778  ORF Transcript_123545/g.360778 Transcript_123545/m.360778 type:complete len:304 (-) Transcript_123545:1007-1918(-)